jgi:hypothetical protein
MRFIKNKLLTQPHPYVYNHELIERATLGQSHGGEWAGIDGQIEGRLVAALVGWYRVVSTPIW